MKQSIEHGMSVRRIGDGEIELVWIHGLGESSTSFLPPVEHLGDFKHTLIDLPGYGRSAWPEPMSLEALAEDLAAWIPRDAIAIGHSMGGVLAMMLGERAAARAIVNIDGNISRGDCNFSGRVIGWSEQQFVDRGFAELRARVYADGMTDLPLRGYAAAMAFASPRMFYRHAHDLVRLSEAGELAARQAALRVPALYVAGVPRGICAESRALLDHHGARWIGIEPAGHWVYLDQTENFAHAIRGLSSRA
ncbi:MAG TPA: alpha/beta hydrolase [Kofleriaceae bacterium]|nr:alpha/beta hydrolase [Kofleriaceae bacterium]